MRAIRRPDSAIEGPTLAYMPCDSAEAVRRLLDLAYRDCHSALDLTFGSGCFWRDPPPPDLAVTTNNPDPSSPADLHLDFTATGLPDGAYDLVLFDPPHVADGGKASIMARRFGTIVGSDGLRDLISDGMLEALRLARLGVLAKVADHAHGGRWLRLTQWVHAATALGGVMSEQPAELYCALHTYRERALVDPKWTVQRAPRSNGATYLAFRKGSDKHFDFDRLYERQLSRGLTPPCP